MFKPLADEPDPAGPPPRGRPYNAELLLTHLGSEAELASRVLERLDPSFTIAREVTGTHCSGKRLRVDAIIRPRDTGQWADPDVAFGIEFKHPDRDLNRYTGWLAQSIDYTHVHWDGYGRRIILTCPGAAAWLDADPQRPEGKPEIVLAKRLRGQLGVGELVLRWHNGLSILVNGEHVWSERAGVVRGRHWPLNLKVGSR